MRAVFATCVAVACWTAGCDSRATASDPASVRPAQRSREFESCGQAADCQDDLRCFERTCRRTARSTIGDYYAAAGALARSRGDLEAAIASYFQALAHYDAEKLALPPDVDCAYGATLAAARARKDHAELGSRVLHRCVLAVPVGLLASAILVVNNVRDLETDRRAGKRTLAVRLGRPATRTVFGLMVYVAFLTAPLPWILGALSPWLLLPLALLPLAVMLVRLVRTHTDGPTLNRALARTGMLQLGFCVLLSIGLLLS